MRDARQCPALDAELVDPEEVGGGVAHQDGGVGGDQGLGAAVAGEIVEQAEQGHLALRGKAGFGLVEEVEHGLAGVDAGGEEGEYALASALLVGQAPFAGAGHGQAAGLGHSVGEAVGTEENSLGAGAEGDVHGGAEGGGFAVVFGFGIGAASTGADGAAGGDGFKERGFAGAVLADQEGERGAQFDLDRAVGEERQARQALAAAGRVVWTLCRRRPRLAFKRVPGGEVAGCSPYSPSFPHTNTCSVGTWRPSVRIGGLQKIRFK